MKRQNVCILMTYLLAVILLGGCNRAAKSQYSSSVKNGLVVAFKKDISTDNAERIFFYYGLSYLKTDDVNMGKMFFYKNTGRTFIVKVPSGKEKKWIKILETEKSISSVDYYEDWSTKGMLD